MKLLNSYTTGFKSAFRFKKLSYVIYAITLLLALVIAIPFGKTLSTNAGNSMAFSKLLKDFDYTVYTDFMHQAAKVIQPYISIAIWMGVFYFIFTIFFAGGILSVLKENKSGFSLKSFWSGCSEYFSRFLRLAIYMLVFQVILALIIYFPLGVIFASEGNSGANEVTYFYTFIIGVLVHLILFIYFLTITDFAKVMMVMHEEYRPLRTIFRSFAFVSKHLFSTVGLYKLLLIGSIILMILYFLISGTIGMSSGGAIFLTFIIQQLYIWTRVFVKIWFLASEIDLYNKIKNESTNEIVNAEPVPGI